MDIVRARTLASACRAEGDSLPTVVAFLVNDFGEDPEIQSQLRESFSCGVVVGNESDHLDAQITMVQSLAATRRRDTTSRGRLSTETTTCCACGNVK